MHPAAGWTPGNVTIQGFMEKTGYSFGRFDFLRAAGELFFLEMNPNGQWAWLEQPGIQGGLFASIVGALERKWGVG